MIFESVKAGLKAPTRLKIENFAFGLLFLAGGILCLFFCLYGYRNNARFMQTAVSTSGVVGSVDLSALPFGDEEKVKVIYNYWDVKGHAYSIELIKNAEGLDVRAGDPVPVLYNPVSPQQAEIGTPFQIWSATILAGLFGALFCVMGVCFFFKRETTF